MQVYALLFNIRLTLCYARLLTCCYHKVHFQWPCTTTQVFLVTADWTSAQVEVEVKAVL